MFTKTIFAIVIAVVASVHAAPSAEVCNGLLYTVIPGDTCFSIAQEFSTTADAIIAENPGVNAGCTNLIAGQGLCIPVTE